MELKSVKVSIGGTVNLGNYENIRLDVAYEAAFEDGDTPEMVTATCLGHAHEALTVELAMLVESRLVERLEGRNHYEAEHVERWIRGDGAFQFMKQFEPAAADELLAQLVDEYKPEPKPEPVAEEVQAASNGTIPF